MKLVLQRELPPESQIDFVLSEASQEVARGIPDLSSHWHTERRGIELTSAGTDEESQTQASSSVHVDDVGMLLGELA
jgi:hypothetical protein